MCSSYLAPAGGERAATNEARGRRGVPRTKKEDVNDPITAHYLIEVWCRNSNEFACTWCGLRSNTDMDTLWFLLGGSRLKQFRTATPNIELETFKVL
ncbi:uncharacterized protein LOC111271797 isoform X2 [Varroa jacobsoni]|uniref:uncharacterized protein LOC111271797 isoform X2 n=1 Tax=Varroa jacobsoni TaxID=62625 RepID=UPI000BF2F540|nr:uncharacterized protein LOC111271797 isoform X2 [Varroa jacobsoni]